MFLGLTPGRQLLSHRHNLLLRRCIKSGKSSRVEITANNVRWLQLFDDDQPDCTLLALHPPDDPAQVVALYLHEKWWSVEDVLRTSSMSRRGLVQVAVLNASVLMPSS